MFRITAIAVALLLFTSVVLTETDKTPGLVTASEIESQVGSAPFDEIAIDLNDDGIADRLVAPSCGGNAGTHYLGFIKVEERFRPIGSVFLHRSGFEVLKTQHNGVADILYYSRSSSTEGTLLRYEFDGRQYRKTVSIRGTSELFDLLRTNETIASSRDEA